MKKLFPVVAILLMLCLLPVYAQAETTELEQVIYDSCFYEQETDVSEFEINHDEFSKVFEEMRTAGQLPWYTETGYSYSYNEASGLMVTFTPKSKDKTQYDRGLYAQALAEAMDACVLEGMTPLQIALSVHDYLILNNIYDETLEKNTGYDLLVNGSTVCAGYAELYAQILNSCGIPCIVVTSTEMEHAWNLVQLGGNWYHVDVTWDDPSPDNYGRVSHQFFLLTDEEISAGEEPHYGWDSQLPCTDTRYADAYWRDVESAICFESKDVSYLIHNKDWDNRIYRRNEATGEETLLYSDTNHYVNTGDGSYAYVHRGLALAEGRLYFNRQDAICSMTTDGKDARKEFTYDTKANRSFLYSFWLEGNTAHITIGSPDYSTSVTTAQISGITPHIHSYTVTETAATCTEEGYSAASCDCGIATRYAPVAPSGHDVQIKDKRIATFFGDGYEKGVCNTCQEETLTVLPQVDVVKWLRKYYIALLPLVSILLIPILARKKKVKDPV